MVEMFVIQEGQMQMHLKPTFQQLIGIAVGGKSATTCPYLRVKMRASAAVAQLDRVLGYEPRGRGFDSCQPHHFLTYE